MNFPTSKYVLKAYILNLSLDHPSADASSFPLNDDPGVELWVLCVFMCQQGGKTVLDSQGAHTTLPVRSQAFP